MSSSVQSVVSICQVESLKESFYLCPGNQVPAVGHEELLFCMKSIDERVIVHITVICTIFTRSSHSVTSESVMLLKDE